MKRFATLTVVCLFIFAVITGCSGGGSSAAGKYVLKTMNGLTFEQAMSDALGGEFNIEDYYEILGISSSEEYMVIELKADGSALISVGGEEPATTTWKQSGNTITFEADGEMVEATLAGSDLFMVIGDEEYVLTKK
jgi:hypothetical protein